MAVVKLILLRVPRCAECERQHEVVERVRGQAPQRVEFRHIDIEQNPDAAGYYRVREHPTTVLEKDGHEVKRWTGVVGEEVLLQALEEHAGEPRGRKTPTPAGLPSGSIGGTLPGRVAVPPPERLPEPPPPMQPEEPPSPPPR